MNAQGRKELNKAIAAIAAATTNVDQLLDALGRHEHLTSEQLEVLSNRCDTARSFVEASLDEEQEKYDNMPESLQSGERGERLQEAIDALTAANEDLDEAISVLEQAAREIQQGTADRGSLLQDLEEVVKGHLEEADSHISDAINA